MRRSTLLTIAICIPLMISTATPAQQDQESKSRPKATSKQEAKMSSRLRAADLERMSNYGPQLPRVAYEAILKDLDVCEYSPRIRWRAYNGYGLALMMAREKEKAIEAFTRAVEAGASADTQEVDQAQSNLEKARAME
jgi:Flp pilus assembly protein TadD